MHKKVIPAESAIPNISLLTQLLCKKKKKNQLVKGPT